MSLARVHPAASIAAAAIVVLIAKLVLVARYGSDLPFWDGFGSEGSHLYPRWFAGDLTFRDLVQPHNEHRVLWTRLAALAELEASGFWSPLLQMTVNAVLHASAIAILLLALCRELVTWQVIVLCAATAVLVALPFGWENTLTGFHSQWHFHALFSIAALWAAIGTPAFTARWLAGTLAAVAAYFSSASAALTLAIIAIVVLAQILVGERKGRAEWVGLVIQVLLFAAVMIDVLSLIRPRGSSLDLADFAVAIAAAAAWPLPVNSQTELALSLAGVLVIYLPLLALALCTLRRPPATHDGAWFALGLDLWVASQVVAIAYGRPAASMLASRYLDIYLLALPAGLAALLMLWHGRSAVAVFALAWAGTIAWGLAAQLPFAWYGMAHRQAVIARAEANVLGYLWTCDPVFLRPPRDLPHPGADFVAAVLERPEIRRILPGELGRAARRPPCAQLPVAGSNSGNDRATTSGP